MPPRFCLFKNTYHKKHSSAWVAIVRSHAHNECVNLYNKPTVVPYIHIHTQCAGSLRDNVEALHSAVKQQHQSLFSAESEPLILTSSDNYQESPHSNGQFREVYYNLVHLIYNKHNVYSSF